jgi:hypothetical protein
MSSGKRLALGVMSQPQKSIPVNFNEEPKLRTGGIEETVPDEIVVEIPEIKRFKDFSSGIAHTYMGEMTYYSTTLDVIAVYLKGQKTLYIEAKGYCEMCLYLLMLPAIFISASCTVLSGSLKDYSVIVSSLTAINSFILGIVTYLKLDAKSEAHRITSYQFDKLQNMCEFYSGKTLMIEDKDLAENIKTFFETIEKKVSEIKDVNQFPIPEAIRYRYSGIYGFNVFAEMKRYKTDRNKNIQEILEIENEIHKNGPQEELIKRKKCLIDAIIEYRNFSKNINDVFQRETEHHRSKRYFYFCLKS